MIFGNTSVIQSNPAEQYQVTNSTVKLAFSIEDWLFCGYNDTNCYTKQRCVYFSMGPYNADPKSAFFASDVRGAGVIRAVLKREYHVFEKLNFLEI